MISDWISRVGSSIPRGFSRQYVLSLLKERPMTGKEIIDKATVQSDGKWKPSPGLVYPLLARLLEEKLVTVDEEGKYATTTKGIEIISDLESFNSILHKQLDVVLRVGNVGKFVAMDMIDRLSAIGAALSSNLDTMSDEERNKYRNFLQSELNKLDEQQKSSGGNSASSKERLDVN